MGISRRFFLLAIIVAAALGYIGGRQRISYRPPASGSAVSNPDLSSGQRYYVVMPNTEALIEHKRVSANPTRTEWRSTGLMPMTREQCEAQLRKRTVVRIGTVRPGERQRNVEVDVTSLRRCVPVDLWDSVEKYSPNPKDVFRP
jgi:hypothetical protein